MNPTSLRTFADERSAEMSRHPLIAGAWRLMMAATGLAWVGLACTLCGCGMAGGWAHNQSGMYAFQNGNYTAARNDFARAMAAHPDKADYAFNLAAAMHKQGDILAAEQMYNRGIGVDPTHQPSYHGLAKLLHEQGRTAEATQLLSSWAGSQPASADAQLELAWLHETTGNTAAATQSLQQAQRLAPRDARVLAHLGNAYAQQGRQAEAVAMFDQAIDLDPSQKAYQQQLSSVYTQGVGYNGNQMASFNAPGTMSAEMSPAPMNAQAPGAPTTMTTFDTTQSFASSPSLPPQMMNGQHFPAQGISYGANMITGPTAMGPMMTSTPAPYSPAPNGMPMGAAPQLVTPPPYQPNMAMPVMTNTPGAPMQNAAVPTVQAF
jgi:Flp pilus assembly protein TadD